MAEARRVQFPRASVLALCAAALAVVAALFAASARVLFGPVGTDVSNRAIADSARPPVFFWCLGWPISFMARRGAEPGRTFWSLGCALLLLHIAIAFHLGHGWSHAAAWEHTRRAGGYGDGIFVNYAFALVWLADVVWAWVAFGSYRARPRWLNWAVHGFLAFVVFNAAVVFGSGRSRSQFCYWFLAPPLCLAVVMWYPRRGSGRPPTDLDLK